MARILTFLITLLPITVFSQTDTLHHKQPYILKDKEYFFQYCKNCDSDIGRPKMLCGHNYRNYFGGYSYTGGHWLELGFSKDLTSCFPEKGGRLFSIAIITNLNKGLVNGIRISYLRDNLGGLQFYFLKFGASLESYTDYSSIDLNFRPEIRITDNMDYSGLLSRINIGYGYNVSLFRNKVAGPEKHQISIILTLRRRGWIS
jgi:hypothetical protein